jgi:ATP phosphoribosyltransferase
VTGSTAREHGLVVGEELFPSETVLMQNNAETTAKTDRVRDILATCEMEEMMTEINIQSLDANNKTTE